MEAAANNQKREAFIEELRAANFSTYFVATHPKYAKGMEAFRFTDTPISPAVPYLWKYADARQRLFELSKYLTTEEAERRNVNFVNPTLKTFMPSATLPTLRGGIQLLLPGEKAFTHRHSANAFRFVVEAPDEGAYTVVEGTRIAMRPGDLILTPGWTWHDHHNEGTSHAIWYDGLDALMAFWIGAGFFQYREENAGKADDQIPVATDRLMTTFGPGLVNREPLLPNHIPPSANPQLYYPYATVRDMLGNLEAAGAGTAADGILLEYVNPLTGGPCFPTMTLSARLLKAKSSLTPMRRTENIVYVVKEGAVEFRLSDNRVFHAEQHDVVAIPSWVPCSLHNDQKEPAIVFSQSDRPLFQKLAFYQEQPA